MKRIVVSPEVAATRADGNGSRRVWVGEGDNRELLTFSRDPVFLSHIPLELGPHIESGRLIVTDVADKAAEVAVRRQEAAAKAAAAAKAKAAAGEGSSSKPSRGSAKKSGQARRQPKKGE